MRSYRTSLSVRISPEGSVNLAFQKGADQSRNRFTEKRGVCPVPSDN
jgi:hypothetical protein